MIKRAVLPTPPFARRFFFNTKNVVSLGNHRSTSSLVTPTILEVLRKVEQGTLSAKDAENLISSSTEGSKTTDVLKDENQKVLESFANLDHSRTKRTGFPEAVFAEGKSPFQVASILNSMALRSSTYNGILATRVDPQLHKDVLEVYKTNSSLSDQLQKISGHIKYHEEARIISVHTNNSSKDGEKLSNEDNNTENFKVAVVCAGTTDIYVAEEAAVTLEQCSIPKEQNKNIDIQVERIYDVGVAGLHRIIRALPRLTSPDVKCVIVCAGMDGALPSVVGGLVSVPVIAVPTSVGYGVSLGGVSAMLTMLNSCSPGVGVVNVDNGFGAAALAYKCIYTSTS